MNMESGRVEYKVTLNDKFEREAVAFLNSNEGGCIYIGIDDTGNVIGISDADSMQLKIIDRIKNNILPHTLGLFDVVLEERDYKNIIKIIISSGVEKPYYILGDTEICNPHAGLFRAIHRCSSVKYIRVFAFLAPWLARKILDVRIANFGVCEYNNFFCLSSLIIFLFIQFGIFIKRRFFHAE